MKTILFLLALTTLLISSQKDIEINKMIAEFETLKKKEQVQFQDYKTTLDKEYHNYKKELSKYWHKPELSTKKEWVSYTKDKKSRSKVDFKNNNYTVEVIAKNLNDAKK